MDKLLIRGGRRLNGEVTVSGAKNAALPELCAALLTAEPVTLTNVPRLQDVNTTLQLLRNMGARAERSEQQPDLVQIDASQVTSPEAPYDLVKTMRASILVLGPLVARYGRARVSLPGGCAIGTRPIDLHLKGLETLGAKIELTQGYVKAVAPDGLKGGVVRFPFVSVGATENILMAATLAHGETVIENAAREPEIVDLARCLTAMGARIEGVGTERIVVKGRTRLHGATYAVMPDRIEAGSYACAAAITNGELELVGVEADTMGAVIEAFEEAGVAITPTNDGLRVARRNGELKGISVTTAPYPGFPTDMQAQFMAMLALADGASVLTETIFENRYMHVPELVRMGADIQVRGRSAFVRGVELLHGAPVMATDLRASMSLVIAGLAARGETTINRIYHLDRGYERLEEKLSAVGADIERVSDG